MLCATAQTVYMIYEEDTIEREAAQFELDTFPMNLNNVLDNPVDIVIKSIKVKIKENNREYAKLLNKDHVEELRYKKLNKRRSYDNELQLGMFNLIEDNRYLEEELTALFEIKIIYAYKHLEINLKQLIGLAYPDEKTGKFYKWDNLIQFFTSKKVEVSKIKEYKRVNQLRIVNNAIKHSGRISDQSINSILEFTGKTEFYYEDLERFYLRVNKLPLRFLNSLKNKIMNDLFDFPNIRIKTIAKSFRQRMTKEQVTRLSKELLKYD